MTVRELIAHLQTYLDQDALVAVCDGGSDNSTGMTLIDADCLQLSAGDATYPGLTAGQLVIDITAGGIVIPEHDTSLPDAIAYGPNGWPAGTEAWSLPTAG